jgi:transcriptional antiterminator RfaH
MLESTFWAAAQVYGNQENRAIINLQRQNFKAFYPFFFDRVGKSKELKSIPLFPGYIFVEIDETKPWGMICSTYGIVRLLMTRGVGKIIVQRLPEDFIQPLLRRLVGNPANEYHIQVGTKVRIKRGPLVENEAIVTMSKDGRLKLLFEILGRETEVEFLEEDVAVV